MAILLPWLDVFFLEDTAEEAATIIVEDLPLDNNADIEDIETDDEPVFDVLESKRKSSLHQGTIMIKRKNPLYQKPRAKLQKIRLKRGEPGWIKTLKKRIREQDSDKEFSSEPMVGNVTNQDQARKQDKGASVPCAVLFITT